MQPLSYGTVGLLFPAISLLMLAYTNRFLGLATLVRQLLAKYQDQPDAAVLQQVDNLRLRITLIRHMQALGVLSLLLCTASLAALFVHGQAAGQLLFGAALVAMLASLVVSLREIQLSVRALEIELNTVTRRVSDR